MRKKRWIAPVFGMLATAAFGQTAIAQIAPPPPPGRRPVAPGPMAYPGRPTYSPVAPDAASRSGWPPLMEAWPTISPFEHAFEQTYNDNGIWFRDVRNQSRTYQVNVEFISAEFKEPSEAPIGHGVIGFPGTHLGEAENGIDPREIFVVKDAMSFSGEGRYIDIEEGPELWPSPVPGALRGPVPRRINRAVQRDAESGTFDRSFSEYKGGLLQAVNFLPPGPDDDIDEELELAHTVLYPVSGQVLGDNATVTLGGYPEIVGQHRENPASPGLRISLGLENEDETGFVWSALWINGQANVFRRGFDDPTRPVLTNIVLFDAPHLGAGAGLGTELGVANQSNNVLALDYNTLFQLEHETEAGGTDLAFYHTPFLDWGWLRMRPMFGARYNYIRETFQFTGRDNGFAYAFDVDGDTFRGDSRFNLPSRDVVLNNDAVPLTVEDPIQLTALFPYETTALSTVRSHLYGPQIGFDMQAGGEHLMITTVTKTGVLVDTERLSLDTTGFGQQEILTGVRPSSNDDKTHTRVVPFVEFNANADINIFPLIPIVNRWHFLENARIRAGWTVMAVGNIQRPLNQIVWRAHESGGPYIKERGRKAWYMQYWNVGVHWTF